MFYSNQKVQESFFVPHIGGDFRKTKRDDQVRGEGFSISDIMGHMRQRWEVLYGFP